MLGTSARLSGLQAALGLSQLERIDQIVARKRDVAAAYAARLRMLPYIELPHAAPGTRPVPWMVGLCLSNTVPFDAAELGVRLAARGIETRPYFTGMHEQPALTALGLFAGETYEVTERLGARGLYLPSSPTLAAADIERVSEAVREAMR
jgi:perosamine synthetase